MEPSLCFAKLLVILLVMVNVGCWCSVPSGKNIQGHFFVFDQFWCRLLDKLITIFSSQIIVKIFLIRLQ